MYSFSRASIQDMLPPRLNLTSFLSWISFSWVPYQDKIKALNTIDGAKRISTLTVWRKEKWECGLRKLKIFHNNFIYCILYSMNMTEFT